MDQVLFRQAMASKGVNSMAELSRKTGIPYSSLMYKMHNDSWDKSDIKNISTVLDLGSEQTVLIFNLS